MNRIDDLSKKFDTCFEQAVANASIDNVVEQLPQEPPQYVECDEEWDEFSELDSEPFKETTQEVATVSDNSIQLKNYGYMEEKLLDIANKSASIVDKIKYELDLVGSGNSPKLYDSFANVTNATTRAIAELRELSKLQMGIMVLSNEKEKKQEDNKIALTPAQLLKIIKDSQKSNDISAEQAEFSELKEA